LGGNGWVCTPRKEKINLRITGSVPRNAPLGLNGEPIHLHLYAYSFINGHQPPGIELDGNWHNPNIVGNDNGSISRAFANDGTVRKSLAKIPYQREILPFTLKQGSKADFDAACKALHNM
jgi:hypothetical protein